MELQKLYVTLAMEMKDFAAGLDTAVGQARGFAQRVGGAFAPVAAFARTAFMGIGAAAIGGFAAAGGAAISMNAQLETSTMQFTTLMGSADEAAAHVENLFAFAAATPFESQEIIDASLKLQTFGGEALNTMENLTLVGDAAAAVNAPIDEVAFWVGRLYSNLQAGAPFGEAAARLQELGIMAPTARTELEGMQAAGLSGSEIFAAFQGQLGTFTGAMELQSGTWQGLMSTIKDNLQMAAADGLKPFFDLAKQGLEGLGAWLSSPEVQEGIKNFAEGFRRVIEQVAAFVTDHVVPFVKNHGPELKAALAAIAVIMLASVIPTMITLVTTMAPIVIAVAAVAAAIYLLRKAWEEHGEQIVSTVRKLWEQVKYLFDTAVQNIRDVIAAFKAFFRGDFEEMERLLKDIWERTWAAVIDTVAKLWSLIKPKFAEFLENLKNWFQNDAKEDIKQKVFDILEGLAEWFGKLWEYLGPKFVEMWESLKTWFAEKVAAVVAFITPIFETIKGVIQGLMANLSEGMSPLDAFIEAIWGIVPQPVLDALVNLRDNVLPGLSATFQTVWGLIQTVVNAALGVIRPALEALMSNARDAAGGLANLTGPLKELWEKVGPLIRAAATVVGGILTALVGVVVGVVRGIANAVGPLIETFVNVAENVIEIVGGIIDFLTGFFDLLVGLFTGNGEKVKAAFAKMGEGVEQIVGGLVEGVWNLFSGLVETVATLIDGFISGIVEFFQNLYDELVGHSIVVDLVETVVQWFEDLVTWIGDALEALWEAVSQPFIEMWGELTAWFAEKVAEAIELGKSIIGGIVQGLQAVGHMITQTIMNFMNAAWDQITAFWEPGSPSKRMHRLGVDIALGLINGIDSMAGEAAAAMDALFERMSDVGGLGGGFARFFERQTLDPMRDQLGEFQTALEGMGEQLGLGADAWLDPMTTLRLMRMAGTGFLATTQEEATARTMLAMMRERGELSAEYIDQQARLAELQEKQAQIGFLQQQYELLKLIRDNGLDTSLLEGLTFGLGADAGALMDAMSAAMQAMIQAAEDELGIHSPSRWAIDTMQNLFGTMTRTAEQEAASLRQTLGRALEPALGAVSQETGGGSVDNSRRATNYGGIHYHVQGNGASPLEALWEMA